MKTGIVVVNGVETVVPMVTIASMVESKKIYKAREDGKYYPGYSLKLEEIDFTAFIDSDRIYAEANGQTVSLD
jgi:hypothetical protein